MDAGRVYGGSWEVSEMARFIDSERSALGVAPQERPQERPPVAISGAARSGGAAESADGIKASPPTVAEGETGAAQCAEEESSAAAVTSDKEPS